MSHSTLKQGSSSEIAIISNINVINHLIIMIAVNSDCSLYRHIHMDKFIKYYLVWNLIKKNYNVWSSMFVLACTRTIWNHDNNKKNCLCNIHVNKSPIPTQNLWVSMSSHTVLKSKKRRRENCLRIWKTHKEFDEPIELMSLETINN